MMLRREIGQVILHRNGNITAMRQRARKIVCWNTYPKNMDYYTERWNELLAS